MGEDNAFSNPVGQNETVCGLGQKCYTETHFDSPFFLNNTPKMN